VDAWAGIAELTLELDPKLWEDQQLASLALQIAEESVSNSVRHLEASQIAITVSIAKQNIMVVETNGTQQIGGSAGMGSAWLQEVSLPGGKFETLPEGTRLTIMM
jgi:glucose-6-phosphate-specific signal transduction histidine kinase